MKDKVLVLGPFPPPIHGQSLATQNLRAQLARAGYGLDTVDLSDGGLRKLFAHGAALLRILKHQDHCYISLNSNSGMWLSACLAFAARLRGRRLWMHHHSYAHLNRSLLAARFLTALAGKRAVHIVLGHRMDSDLHTMFPGVRTSMVLNNAGLVDIPYTPRTERRSELTLGFLGNITVEKGITAAIDTVVTCATKMNIRFVVGGPAQTREAEAEIHRVRTILGGKFDYRGRLDHREKEAFFRDIDILLFPSFYKNEASPLVIFEALSAGVPVVATERGCICEDVGRLGGRVIRQEFALNAISAISELSEDILSSSKNARRQFELKLAEHFQQFEEFAESLDVRGPRRR
ncbi:glycosyltransferase family 4 protein [Rhizobium terrae]|uniref:glycosyltransferase family 4 protein n=1 Tax=Rhizobium terrae TaxID=2171756 RepID=UPI000E3E6645|nr:glycosyltransferase family 4 protein [Rhizobium terrae]